MKKESVQKFDLEAAFKALNEVEIPVVKGIRPNRENLQEKFNRKLVSDILVEDYFDVGDSSDLEQAQEEREAEIAKAKLARIEKIVDLEAETEEDLLPSYVGKFIMQCPQCMMLFYKNEEDIEKSEENPEIVNLNEPCQHCGNSSGYTLIGKVDTVGEDEAAQYDAEDFSDENELDLNFDEEPAEETTEEETEEAGEDAATEEGNEEELDLAPVEDEKTAEESDEEEVEESLTKKPLRESWEDDVAKADQTLEKIIKLSNNEDYDDGDGYWEEEYTVWCNRYLYYSNTLNNAAQTEALCEEYSTENCQFYIIEDDEEDDPVSEIGYTLTKDVKESLTEEIDAATKDKLTKEVKEIDEKIAYYENQLKLAKDAADIQDFNRKIDGFYKLRDQKLQLIKDGNLKMSDLELEVLDEATIHMKKADMEKLDKEVEEAQKEVAKYKIPMKAQKNSAGQTENVPDFEAVPEAQREAAKKAYDRYQKALKARPSRSQYDIIYDEALQEELSLQSSSKQLNGYATAIHKAFESRGVADRFVVRTVAKDSEFGTAGHIAVISNQGKLSDNDVEVVKTFVTKQLKDQGAIADTINVQHVNNTTFVIFDNIKAGQTVAITAESLTEDADLNKQLDLYNDFIKYLQNMVEQDEDALERAKKQGNKEVIAAIQKRLDNSKAELEAALPATVKDEVAAEELPTPEEADMEAAAENKEEKDDKKDKAPETEEKKESLTENLGTATEELEEAAPATVSTLKRKLAATELIVKELKTYPLFSTLSTRTIQRVLLPYYIENMGRADMSAQSVLEFFEYEGFAPYVLDHFTTIDPLARKELLKADAQFMEIFMAYVNEYDLYIGNKDELEAGTDAFDAAFEIAFALNPDGTIDDADICHKTIQTFGLMYVAGKFDRTLVVESLIEDTDSLDTLLDSEEFKKPISDKEIESIKAQYEGLEEEVAPGAESVMMMRNIVDTWESVEDLDDETFNKLTENYLTEVYSNVKSFEATDCDLKDNKLVVEGTITFKSGKTKPTTFVYEAKETSDKKVILEGLNKDFSSEKAFTLNCKVDTENCLIVESLNYKYIINDTLVEGLLK